MCSRHAPRLAIVLLVAVCISAPAHGESAEEDRQLALKALMQKDTDAALKLD